MVSKKVGINLLLPSNSVVETTELQLADNMGVATYQQMQNRLRELLPPEEDMKRILEGENETLDTKKEDGDE